MNKYITIGILLIVVIGGSYVYAEQINNDVSVCVKKNGEARFNVFGFTKKQSCGENEVKIGMPGKSAHLYDGNNRDLGQLISYSNNYNGDVQWASSGECRTPRK